MLSIGSPLYVVFDGTPRTRIDIRATSGAMDGEASSKGIILSLQSVYLWNGGWGVGGGDNAWLALLAEGCSLN